MGIEWWAPINQDHCSTLGSFAQWRYSNQWSNREVLLLLVENYTQYPAISTWNIVVLGNFWKLLQEQSYHVESTSSCPITEVKQRRVVLVLGWVTAWEYTML